MTSIRHYFHFFLLVSTLWSLSGCLSQIPSLKQYRKSWLGHPIEELKEATARPNGYDSYAKEIGWKETTYPLTNGNWVYVELDRKDCFIHWEVNSQGIIVDSRAEGRGCAGQ